MAVRERVADRTVHERHGKLLLTMKGYKEWKWLHAKFSPTEEQVWTYLVSGRVWY